MLFIMKVKNVFTAYKNACYQALGLFFVALGIIGIVLPVMPTTIFFILALACFTRSSPTLAAWLLNHPRYGVTLQQWQAYKVVPKRAKWFAATGMLIGLIILMLGHPPWWVVGLVASIEIVVMIYLLSRPSTVPKV